jgi:hypothetical protein
MFCSHLRTHSDRFSTQRYLVRLYNEEAVSVYCEVGTEFLNIYFTKFELQRITKAYLNSTKWDFLVNFLFHPH